MPVEEARFRLRRGNADPAISQWGRRMGLPLVAQGGSIRAVPRSGQLGARRRQGGREREEECECGWEMQRRVGRVVPRAPKTRSRKTVCRGARGAARPTRDNSSRAIDLICEMGDVFSRSKNGVQIQGGRSEVLFAAVRLARTLVPRPLSLDQLSSARSMKILSSR